MGSSTAVLKEGRLLPILESLGVKRADDGADELLTLFAEASVSQYLKKYIPSSETIKGVQMSFINADRAGNSLVPIDNEGARDIAMQAYHEVCDPPCIAA